jgi:uncharacterized protein (TIGR02217 family)
MPQVDDVVFPTHIGFGSRGGPQFRTDVAVFSSGAEQRNQSWEMPQECWNVAYGVKSEDDLEELLDFFMERRGRARGFKFLHPYRNQLIATPMTLLTSTTFQIVKRYPESGGVNALNRKIFCPATDLVIRKNGVVQTSGWTVDRSTGIVTFTTAPGTPIPTAEGTFYFPMRFDVDKLELTYVEIEAGDTNVPIVELRA